MKKLLAWVVSLAMILSLCSVATFTVSADDLVVLFDEDVDEMLYLYDVSGHTVSGGDIAAALTAETEAYGISEQYTVTVTASADAANAEIRIGLTDTAYTLMDLNGHYNNTLSNPGESYTFGASIGGDAFGDGGATNLGFFSDRACTLTITHVKIEIKRPDVGSQVIAADETKSATIANPKGRAYFTFTPTENGTYRFFSSANSTDTYGHLYDESTHAWVDDDDGGGNGNFSIRYKMTAGRTYLLIARFYSDSETGSFDVTLKKIPAATALSITEEIVGYVDESHYLSWSFEPEDCVGESVSWSSDDETVVTVDDYGNVYFNGEGTATITGTSENGLTDTCAVTVKVHPKATAIEIEEELHGHVGEGAQLNYTLTPDDCIPESVGWSSDKESVATVDDWGYVTFVSEGTATITATSENGLTDTCAVTVTDYETIALNETKTVVIENGGDVARYKFTPDADGTYIFYSSAIEEDTYGVIYEGSISYPVAYDDESGRGGNFAARYAMTAGTTYLLEARYYSSGDTGSFKVSVKKAPKATAITLNQKELSGYEGSGEYLSALFTPEDCITEAITWSSDDESVATVDDWGYVTYVSEGTATITATSASGLTDTCAVTVLVRPAATSVEIDTKEINGYVGDSKWLYASLHPDNCVPETITWSSDDDTVATVDEYGYVTLVGEGTATITATSEKGLTDTCAVTAKVHPKATAMEIEEELTGYVGTVGSLSVMFAPDDCIWESVSWSSDDESVATVDDWGNVTFVSAGTATITATSEKGLTDTCAVTVKDYEPIAVDETKPVAITHNGESVMFTFTPAETGIYVFYSTGDEDTCATLYDASLSYLTYVDYGGEDDNFAIIYELTAGTTYIFKAQFDYYDDTGSFDVTLIKAPAATGMVLVDELDGYVGEGNYLDPIFVPTFSLSEKLTWTSSDESVATVDEYGLVTFVAAGEAEITATSENGLTATCYVTVKDYPKATEIRMDETYRGFVGETGTLYPNFYPSDAIEEKITWTSSDETVVRVNKDGKMTFLAEGTAVVTATSENGLVEHCLVTVSTRPLATAIKLNTDKLQGFVGESARLWANFTPNNCVTEAVEWSSDNMGVATVNSYGTVNFVSTGTATITATSESGLTATCAVTVSERPAATAIFIPAEYSGYVGVTIRFLVSFEPYDCVQETIKWSSDDESVASVIDAVNGRVKLLSEGTATITATSESGLTATCALTVTDYDPIAVDETKTVQINLPGDKKFFKFVPETTGTYVFYSSADDDDDTYGYIYDENLNQLKYNDDGGEDCNFAITCEMTAGTTYILAAKFYDSNDTGSFPVSLIQAVAATGIEMMDELDGYVGESVYLGVEFTPAGARTEDLTWSTSDKSVARVSASTGKITLVSPGEAIITATSESGLTATCKVTVSERPTVTALTIDKTYHGFVGDVDYLDWEFEPKGCVDETITWTSSDPSVVLVSSSGRIILLAPGEATFTATSTSGASDTCTVTVMEKTFIYEGTPYRVEIADGAAVTVFFTPEESGSYLFYTDNYSVTDRARLVIYNSADWAVASGDLYATCYLEAGETYEIVTRFLKDETMTGAYDLAVVQEVPVTGLEWTVGGTRETYVNRPAAVDLKLTPWNAIQEKPTWTIEDESIATVYQTAVKATDDGIHYRCIIMGLAPGTTTLTATLADGRSISCPIVVKDFDPILVGQTLTATVIEPATISYFKFTPETDGTYRFYSTTDKTTLGFVTLEAGGSVLGMDVDNEGGGFSFTCGMTAGTTYVFGTSFTMDSMTGSYSVTLEKVSDEISEPSEEPTSEPTSEPSTEDPGEASEPPVEPSEPPVEPSEPPVEPSEPPVEPTTAGFEYEVINDGTEVRITRYTGDDYSVVVPDAIDGLPVTEIGDNAFGVYTDPNTGTRYYLNVQELHLPRTLRRIGNNAFAGCANLETVTFDGTQIDLANLEIGEGNEILTSATWVTEAITGDANGDGSVDMKDVLLVRKSIAGMTVTIDETAADVDKDGSVTMKDVLKIRKYIAKMIDSLDT